MTKAADIKTWPFVEARNLDKHLKETSDKSEVVFETGYGASGLPHLGTFGEVARTAMVRRAFELIRPESKTRLICFSDDMDALRKVPTNLPQQDMLAAHLDQPLSRIPDPFGTHDSFAAHNNARLRDFLNRFKFDYEFMSATDCYQSGMFDDALIAVLENYDAVKNIILPTLGAERRETYSPFLPICPRTGRVLMAKIIAHNTADKTITYIDPDTKDQITVKITGGACKLQWKADWAMRWRALGVDYEMAGKDLSDSMRLSGKICRTLGGTPPIGLSYELFLDENGEKISKSRGNGLSIEDWLRYAPMESLARFMYHPPKKAKRLYFDVIPREMDDYLKHMRAWKNENQQEQLRNPIWYIGTPSDEEPPVMFSQLLNLVSASHAREPDMLWGFIHARDPDVTAETHPFLARLIPHAISYFEDFVLPNKTHRLATQKERAALETLRARFDALPDDADAEIIQQALYDVGKEHQFENLRDWFQALYEILLGESSGSRFGSFVALYGLERTKTLIQRAINGENLNPL